MEVKISSICEGSITDGVREHGDGVVQRSETAPSASEWVNAVNKSCPVTIIIRWHAGLHRALVGLCGSLLWAARKCDVLDQQVLVALHCRAGEAFLLTLSRQ